MALTSERNNQRWSAYDMGNTTSRSTDRKAKSIQRDKLRQNKTDRNLLEDSDIAAEKDMGPLLPRDQFEDNDFHSNFWEVCTCCSYCGSHDSRDWVHDPAYVLHNAVILQDAAAVEAMLASADGSALINSLDSNGLTPLMLAAGWCCDLALVKLFCKNGADTLMINENTGLTALHLAISYASHELEDYLSSETEKDLIRWRAWRACGLEAAAAAASGQSLRGINM